MTPRAKQAADIITWSRASLGVLFAWLGFSKGEEALPAVVVLMIANWTGDSIDGPLARRSPQTVHTWIGDNDLAVDMFVVAGLLAYMTAAGFVPWQLAAVYALFWLLVFWWRGIVYALGVLFQAPIYAWFIVVAFTEATPYALLILAWILAAMLVTWPKFPKVMIPGFLNGLRDAISRRRNERDLT